MAKMQSKSEDKLQKKHTRDKKISRLVFIVHLITNLSPDNSQLFVFAKFSSISDAFFCIIKISGRGKKPDLYKLIGKEKSKCFSFKKLNLNCSGNNILASPAE